MIFWADFLPTSLLYISILLEQCAQFCSKDELWEAAKEEEMKIPWKEVQEGLPVPPDQYQERFCEDWMELDWTQ